MVGTMPTAQSTTHDCPTEKGKYRTS